jgi:hypothetical protein
MAKQQIVHNVKAGTYQVQTTDKKGSIMVRDTLPSLVAMDTDKAIQVYQGLAKDMPNKRLAAWSILTAVLSSCADTLVAWKGGVSKDSSLPKELATSFRDAETAFYKPLMDHKHAGHKAFLGRLPVADAQGRPLDGGTPGKTNPEAQFQAFLTAMRVDSTYSNNKNVLLGAWGYLGIDAHDEGGLIPPEILRIMVANARVYTERDNSVLARVQEIHKEMIGADTITAPPAADIAPTLQALRELVSAYESFARGAAQQERMRTAATDVKAATTAAMEQANAKHTSEPSAAVKKATEAAPM